MSAGPYTCTTSIGTVDGAVLARAGSLNIQGGFICIEPNYADICHSDLDGSGLVDTGDMAILLMLFGPTLPPFRFADLDSTGWINMGDLAILLMNYGEQCGAVALRGPRSIVEEPAAATADAIEVPLSEF